jgi:cytochrome c biogenesis protein CcdA
MINGEVKIEGEFNETSLRKIIDVYIFDDGVVPSPPPTSLSAILALAFSLGFAETFSPCLIVLLSFVLSYTVGKITRFKEGMLQVMFFGVGFVVAAVSIGLAVGLMFLSMETFRYTLTWIVCILAIFLGTNLLGLFKTSSFKTKPLVEKLSRKYAFTYSGLLLLGFLFYFLDPCIAPIFVAMLPLLTLEYMPLIMLVFSFGVILPFIIVGVFSSSISKLVRSTYRHKSKIRAISGLILIAYALYLIIFYLL